MAEIIIDEIDGIYRTAAMAPIGSTILLANPEYMKAYERAGYTRTGNVSENRDLFGNVSTFYEYIKVRQVDYDPNHSSNLKWIVLGVGAVAIIFGLYYYGRKK